MYKQTNLTGKLVSNFQDSALIETVCEKLTC